MKTVSANPDQPLSAAERDAWQQFEASKRDGQVLFHPWVHPKDAAPHCVVFFERIARLVVRFMPGRCRRQGSKWLSEDATGANFPLPDPLQETWRSANAVRRRLKPRPEIGVYAIPVLVLPDMEPDASILAEAQRRKVRVLFGGSDLVDNLADLPTDAEMRTEFIAKYIEEEVQLLMERPEEETDQSEASDEATAEEASPAVGGPAGAITVLRVDVMNIYVNIFNGGAGDEAPVITVQGR